MWKEVLFSAFLYEPQLLADQEDGVAAGRLMKGAPGFRKNRPVFGKILWLGRGCGILESAKQLALSREKEKEIDYMEAFVCTYTRAMMIDRCQIEYTAKAGSFVV